MKIGMEEPQTHIYEFGEFRLDAAKRSLSNLKGEIAPLMPKAFETLLYLVQNSGKIIGKDEMLSAIWPDTIVEENNLTQNVSALRRVFGEKPGEHRYIVTIPGNGYKFVAEVQQRREREPIENVATGESIQGDVSDTNGVSATRPRKLRFAMLALGIIALGFAGLYLWRDTTQDETPIRTIAVLPFKPLTIETRNEPMELGMADSLISKLSSGEDLIVRPLSSVRRFTLLDEDTLAAGRSLAVEAVLDGTIQMSVDQIRVSARLLRVSDGKQIWAEQFDEKRTDIFRVQDSITGKVASALNIKIRGGNTALATSSFEAYESYMFGRLHAGRLVMPEVKKGLLHYEKAIEADPNYAAAYVGIADAQRSLALSNDVDPQIAFSQAKSAASRAMALNPDLAESQMAVGLVALFYEWDWNRAEMHLGRAVELNPNNAEIRAYYAHVLSNTGQHEKALAEAKRATELNPVSLLIRTFEGQFLVYAGQNDSAIASLRAAVDLDPNFWLSHHVLSAAYINNGSYAEAVRESDEAKRLAPFQTHSLAYRGFALAKDGKTAEARQILDQLLAASRDRYVPPCHIAMLYTALGENEKALDQLEKAYLEKDVRIAFLKVEPRWNSLRTEPRFIDLMKRLNFE
ncbi:MAG: tetratricopeptide repeat protein [Acidobacteria bacterium]|nr:tetratricopeptide repeat protein [Acidobacteriota bacterium]